MLSHLADRGSRRVGLDLIRGIAIALVLLRHAWPAIFAGAGIVGVVMFFALSGYLITSMLQREYIATGAVSFRRFGALRALRLVPALAFMLLVFVIIESIFNPLGDRGVIVQTVLAALFYLRDLPLPFATSPAINTLWTLAVEEQFYLVWPVLLVAALRRSAVGKLVVFSIVFLLLASSASVLAFANDPATVYILPTTWASSLVIGAAAALYRERVVEALRRTRVSDPAVLVSCAVVFAALSLTPDAKNLAVMYIFGGPIVAVMTVGLIVVVERWDALPFRALEPVRMLGVVSYGVYLWNALTLNWLSFTGQWSGLLSIVATVLLAIISWHSVERVGRALRLRLLGRSALAKVGSSNR